MLTLYATDEAIEFQPIDLTDLPEERVAGVLRDLLRHAKKVLGNRALITESFFSARAMNVLKRAEIRTMQELSDWPKTFPGGGAKTFQEFREQLDLVGLPYPLVVQLHKVTHVI